MIDSVLPEESQHLIRSLLEARETELESSIAAVEAIPELILVADQGVEDMSTQLALVRHTLAQVSTL